MSTRCDIIIRDNKPSGEKIKLFHRLDGYPQGVGKFLIENVLKKLKESPNFKINEVANFLVKNKEDEDYMITTGRHPDIEYRFPIVCHGHPMQSFYSQSHLSKLRFDCS